RACERAAIRQAPRLLPDRVAVRADLVRPGTRQGRQRGPAVHTRLLPAGLRPVHRDHHAEPASGDPEEPQAAPPARAVPRGALQDLLPARLPVAGHEVRAGQHEGVLTARGHRSRRPGYTLASECDSLRTRTTTSARCWPPAAWTPWTTSSPTSRRVW